MGDMNNMMRIPGQHPNGMPMPPMNMNPQMMQGQMGHPPFMVPGGQHMPPQMFQLQQMPGMPMPHHMAPPPMMNQFPQYPMTQMPIINPYQPPNFNLQNGPHMQPPPMQGVPQHHAPPSNMSITSAPPILNGVTNPNVNRETIQAQPSQTSSSSTDSQWLKLFVSNIHPDVPDEFIKKLLEECGQVEKWKRQSDEKGNLNKFGIVEFKLFESVLKCIRILDGFDIMEEKLVVKSSQTTQTFIEQWKKLKSKQWEDEQKQKEESEYTSFDQFLEKDDSEIKERISAHMKSIDEKVEKVREKKREDEEKKLHPRERERDNKRKHQQREIEKKGRDKLREWLQIEEDLSREKRKEREREKERERNKQKALERELAYTEDVERHKQRSRMIDRKRQRMRELEEDENDRRKEYELLNPPEPEFNIPMPEEPMEEFEVITINSNNANGHNDKGVTNLSFEEIELPYGSGNGGRIIEEEIIEYSIDNPRNNIVNQAISKLNFQFKQDFDDKIKKGIYVMPQMEQEYEEPVANINEIHQSRSIQVEKQATVDNTLKQVFGGLEEEEEEERQRNLRKIDLPKIGNARFLEQREQIRKQQLEQIGEQQKVTPAPRQLTEEEMKKELKEIISLIPPASNNNAQLFGFTFNWDLFENSGLLEKKIKPFLLKKSAELLGQEEQSFVDMIIKKIQQKPTPEKLVKHISKILDRDESEKFIASLWRIMIFETLKYERFLHIV